MTRGCGPSFQLKAGNDSTNLHPDAAAIGCGMLGMLSMYENTARRTGRTTAMLDRVKQHLESAPNAEAVIVCAREDTIHHVKQAARERLGERLWQRLAVLSSPPERGFGFLRDKVSGVKGLVPMRVFPEHTFVEALYRHQIRKAEGFIAQIAEWPSSLEGDEEPFRQGALLVRPP